MQKLTQKILAASIFLSCSYGAAAELVVVVNKANPIHELSLTNVVDIYTGRYMAFPNGISAEPVDLPNESSEKENFYYQATGLSLAKINSYWARLKFTGRYLPPIQLETPENALNYVQRNTNAVAYVDEKYVTGQVKIVYRF
ncbi:hypothetical protein [Catenovulum agarivorans]|uniref:hypothetical protein n=1 Tax=Catenovulum agarivorans TaxID=1172192 RepID=UPI0002F8F3C8|nr:hypothetical protein [Catenovulum agarivorans]